MKKFPIWFWMVLVTLLIWIDGVIFFLVFKPKTALRPERTNSVIPNTPIPTPTPSNPPQYVLLSFDGSRDLTMWEETRRFAQDMRSKGKPVAFTYFISGVYFLPVSKARFYQPPRLPAGATKIGFADTVAEIPKRVEQVRLAISEGHEIGSHLNGHFTGGSLWDKAGWLSEMNQFKVLLADVGKNSGIESMVFPNLDNIKGIRAPNLSKNTNYLPAVEEASYLYDSSYVGKIDDFAYKIGNVWEIPLKNIAVAGTKLTAIAMDYNFWERQSKAKEVAKRGTPLWEQYKKQVVDSYVAYFTQLYYSNRAPVVIGHHFSLWNDGVYFEALKEFADNVCDLPEVKCVTFGEYVRYLEKTSSTSPGL